MLRLYPWVHQFCNMRSSSEQTRPVTFPDVNPADISTVLADDARFPQFSMAAGDFLEVYTEPGEGVVVAAYCSGDVFINSDHHIVIPCKQYASDRFIYFTVDLRYIETTCIQFSVLHVDLSPVHVV